VTRWSRLDNRWEGVRFTDVVERAKAKPEAEYVLVLAEEGYTSNIPLKDLLRPDVLFAFEHDGEAVDRGTWRPLRLIVPHLYAWKSVKWVRGLMLLDHDRLGFWETQRVSRVWGPLERAEIFGNVGNIVRQEQIIHCLNSIQRARAKVEVLRLSSSDSLRMTSLSAALPESCFLFLRLRADDCAVFHDEVYLRSDSMSWSGSWAWQ